MEKSEFFLLDICKYNYPPLSRIMKTDELASKLDKLLNTDYIKLDKSIINFEGINEIANELTTIEDYRTNVNSLDQLFFEIVNDLKNNNGTKGKSPLKKLISLYRSAGPKPSDLITWNLRRFSLAYSALSLTIPQLFEGNENENVNLLFDELLEIVLTRNPNVFATFFEDWAQNLLGNDDNFEIFDAIFGGICGAIVSKIQIETKSGGDDKLKLITTEIPNLIISVLGPMCQVPSIAEFLIKRSGYFKSEFSTPDEALNSSLIGVLLKGIAVDAPDNFDAMRSLLPNGYGPPLPQQILLTAFQNLRDSTELILSRIQENILLPLIKGNVEFRQMVLKHVAAVAKINSNRAKLQAEIGTINSDGFIMGWWGILLKLCDPFTLAGDSVRKSKLPLIGINFLIYNNDLIDWSDVSRAGMDPQEFETELSKIKSGTKDENVNFITQIFLLSMQFFKIGPIRLIQEYGTTSREFNEIENELKRLEETRGTWSVAPNSLMISNFIEKLKKRMNELVDLRISYDFHLMNPIIKKSTIALISFFLALYKSISENNKRALPEFFLESVWEYLLFMSRVDGEIQVNINGEQDEILELAVELLPASDLIKNPYIRAKQVEIFFSLVINDEERRTNLFSSLDRRVLSLLVPNMMKFYVQVESLGTSTAFYDKFSIRYHLTKILLKLLAVNSSNFILKNLEKTLDDAVLVRFINLAVSDATYLLDESLSKLTEIREKQIQVSPLTAEEQKLLSQTERQCQSLLSLGSESLTFLAKLSSVMPAAFLRPEILDRLTAMLNFNLVLLAGPRCSKLKVNNPSKYNFNPRALLGSLIDIYLTLGGEEGFVRSVAGDERSFSPQLFESCVGIMKRTGMTPETINSFTCLSGKILAALGKDLQDRTNEEMNVDSENIPDEYLDPILFNLMVDPVLLPTSQMIVDRATIQAHLLNDQHDPFNRQPLNIDQVQAVPELKAEIDAFLKSNKIMK